MEWDINDATIPNTVNHYDPYQDWPDDHIRLVYPLNSEPARRHNSGWAMRNTNNHNVHILKKSCLGVLMCSRRCKFGVSGGGGGGVTGELRLRPAICDKARKKQLGRPCPNPKCGGGSLVLVACKGNSGFPCTHFWRHTGNAVFFQAKGVHDHPRPEVKNSNVEVRKTVGLGKLGSSRSTSGGGGVTNYPGTQPHPNPPSLPNPIIKRKKSGRKPKTIKREPLPYGSSHPRKKSNGCVLTNMTSTQPKVKGQGQGNPRPLKPSTPHPHPPIPDPYHHPTTSSLNFPEYNSNHTHKPTFPDWMYYSEDIPPPPPSSNQSHTQKSLYPLSTPSTSNPSTSTCPGCGQPHFYCSCGYPHPVNHPNPGDFLQVQHLDPGGATPSTSGSGGGGFIPFNNNLDTFKPSDIFNFEVNLNLNYSAYTTTNHNHTHYGHGHHHPHNNHNHISPPQISGGGGGNSTGYYGSGCGEDQTHFSQTHPLQQYNSQQVPGQMQQSQFYNNGGGGSGTGFYDGWSSNNNSTGIGGSVNVNSSGGGGMLYQ